MRVCRPICAKGWLMATGLGGGLPGPWVSLDVADGRRGTVVVSAEQDRECLLSIPTDIGIHSYTSERYEKGKDHEADLMRFCTSRQSAVGGARSTAAGWLRRPGNYAIVQSLRCLMTPLDQMPLQWRV